MVNCSMRPGSLKRSFNSKQISSAAMNFPKALRASSVSPASHRPFRRVVYATTLLLLGSCHLIGRKKRGRPSRLFDGS